MISGAHSAILYIFGLITLRLRQIWTAHNVFCVSLQYAYGRKGEGAGPPRWVGRYTYIQCLHRSTVKGSLKGLYDLARYNVNDAVDRIFGGSSLLKELLND